MVISECFLNNHLDVLQFVEIGHGWQPVQTDANTN